MNGPHLRLVTAAATESAVTAETAKSAVESLNLRHGLELVDSLAALTAAHWDPVAAAEDLQELRRDALAVVNRVFDQLHNHRARCAG